MPRPQKPIPPDLTIRRWAEEKTDLVLSGMDPIHRDKLPRALLLDLAELCYNADDRLRDELKEKHRPGWTSLVTAIAQEFGFAIEFMAQVREIWFVEFGAKDGIHTVDSKTGLRVGTEATFRLLLRLRPWQTWETQFELKNRRKPTHKERAAKAADFRFKITEEQVQKVWDEFPSI